MFSLYKEGKILFLRIFSLCGFWDFFAHAISSVVGLTIQQCPNIKLVHLEAFHLPLANNNDNALGTHLTHGLDCKLCPARAAGRAAAKEAFETPWTDLSSVSSLLYLQLQGYSLFVAGYPYMIATKPSNDRENLFPWPLPKPQHCAEEARQQL